ncbi:helix-turn-helix transcriptional regulator [Diplocloster hominis]|uniref:helix-turn-helix domain-containing protein n=1 Tax=Diplocloster hominis TaxID=3079010 RepID=UPI0031BBBBF6
MTQKIKQDINLGNNIRQLRLRSNMTQEAVTTALQLAGCSLSRSAYSQIECGTYNIRVSELSALCKIFQVDYNTLFQGI